MIDRKRDACATFFGLEDELAVAVEFGTEFAGEVFDAGSAGVLNDMFNGESRARQDLVADAGDAEFQPVELVVSGGDDGKFHFPPMRVASIVFWIG